MKKSSCKILIACEFSGTIRDAFCAAGFDAISADLRPSLTPGKHYQGDIKDVLYSQEWDLLIAHPPCKYLSYAGSRSWHNEGRAELRAEALQFFELFLNCKNAKRICVENPMGEPAKTHKSYQIIHPYYFGDEAQKRTLLWLKNLPPLLHNPVGSLFATHVGKGEMITDDKGRKRAKWCQDAYAKSKDERDRIRSKTFPGIAQAMVSQWGAIL